MSDKLKFTPGPWGNETEIPWPGPNADERAYRTLCIKSIPEDRTVAMATGWKPHANIPLATPTDEARANAALIAAAPELYEILKRISNAHNSGNNGAYMGEAVLCEMFAKMADEALAKAEGRAQ